MKGWNKVICAALAGALCLGAAACGQTGGGDDNEVVRPETDTNDYRMEETLTVNTALIYNEDWYTGTGFTAGENPVYSLYESAINLKMVNKWALPTDGYNQQITSSHITGDYPDIFYVNDVQLDELIRNDAIVNLTPYYEQWGTQELKTTLEYNDKINFAYSTREGKIWGIPKVTDDCDRPTVWARTDWIANLNKKATPAGATTFDSENNLRFHADGPKSLDEFWALAEACALEDPDGNGRKDTFGISISSALNATNIPIYNAYNAYPTTLKVNDAGKLVNLGVDPAMKKPLAKLAEMVQKGVIDSDYISWSDTDAWSKAASGASGLVLGPAYLPTWPLSNTRSLDENADWCASPMYQENGERIIPTRSLNVAGYYVVRKGFSHPEALIKILNNLATSDVENDWYKGYMAIGDVVDKDVFNWMPVSIDRSTVNFERHSAFMHAIEAYEKTGEFDESLIEARDFPTRYNMVKGYYLDKNFSRGWAMYKTFYEGVTIAKGYGNNGDSGIYNDWNYPLSTSGKARLANWERTTNQVRNRIISGKDSVESFDTYITEWETGAGRQLMREMQDYIDALRNN